MRFVLLLLAISVSVTSLASDTLRYFVDVNKIRFQPAYDYYYRIVYKENQLWHVKDYFVKEHSLQMDGVFLDDSLKIPVGMFSWYHPNKQLEKKGRYIDGKRDGMWKTYGKEGNLVDSSLFKEGKAHKFSYAWFNDGSRKMIGRYNDDGMGSDTAWYATGIIDFCGAYSGPGVKTGEWVYNYETGKLASTEYFIEDSVIKIACFAPSGSAEDCDIDIPEYNKALKAKGYMDGVVYNYVAEMPKPLYDVNKFLENNIYYPLPAREINLQGRVLVQFVVEKDGAIADVRQVSARIGGGIDEEAIRVVSTFPKWMPGKIHHRPVDVFFTIPVSFKIQ